MKKLLLSGITALNYRVAFRALKVWLTLQYYGTRRIAEAIADDISLAAYLGEVVSKADDFELLAPVELSICCFRYVPRDSKATEAELNQLNERIMELVQKGGRAYVSNATVNGRFALRACITNFRTTKSDIDQTIEAIRDAGRPFVRRTQMPRHDRDHRFAGGAIRGALRRHANDVRTRTSNSSRTRAHSRRSYSRAVRRTDQRRTEERMTTTSNPSRKLTESPTN